MLRANTKKCGGGGWAGDEVGGSSLGEEEWCPRVIFRSFSSSIQSPPGRRWREEDKGESDHGSGKREGKKERKGKREGASRRDERDLVEGRPKKCSAVSRSKAGRQEGRRGEIDVIVRFFLPPLPSKREGHIVHVVLLGTALLRRRLRSSSEARHIVSPGPVAPADRRRRGDCCKRWRAEGKRERRKGERRNFHLLDFAPECKHTSSSSPSSHTSSSRSPDPLQSSSSPPILQPRLSPGPSLCPRSRVVHRTVAAPLFLPRPSAPAQYIRPHTRMESRVAAILSPVCSLLPEASAGGWAEEEKKVEGDFPS